MTTSTTSTTSVTSTTSATSTTSTSENAPQIEAKIIIFLQHFLTKDGPERQKELDDALIENIKHPNVARVYQLSENKSVHSHLVNLKNSLSSDEQKKFEICNLNKWLFYSDAMNYAVEKVRKNHDNLVCCIINSDCFLDRRSKWEELCQFVKTHPNTVICQSRVEKPESPNDEPKIDPKFEPMAGANTQDAWFFNFKTLSSLPKDQIVDKFSFALGRLGCDNLMAYKLNAIGLKVINFGSRYWVIHNDTVRKGARNYVPVDMTKLGSKLVPDYDKVVDANGIKFLSALGIPMEEAARIAIKVAYYALMKKRMTIDEKLTMGDILKRFSNDELYKVCCQILNGFVKITNT